MRVVTQNIQVPANDGDAGFDLLSTRGFALHPGERYMVNTQVRWQPPIISRFAKRIVKWLFGAKPEYVMFLKPRSGLAAKQGIDILGGVVDASYRGEIGVILLNTGSNPVYIETGDKIAQAVILLAFVPSLDRANELSTSSRGTSGFGSTGK